MVFKNSVSIPEAYEFNSYPWLSAGSFQEIRRGLTKSFRVVMRSIWEWAKISTWRVSSSTVLIAEKLNNYSRCCCKLYFPLFIHSRGGSWEIACWKLSLSAKYYSNASSLPSRPHSTSKCSEYFYNKANERSHRGIWRKIWILNTLNEKNASH